ncbi:MAG: hypothetical protein Q9161_001680 [Pseudevernia consocians]
MDVVESETGEKPKLKRPSKVSGRINVGKYPDLRAALCLDMTIGPWLLPQQIQHVTATAYVPVSSSSLEIWYDAGMRPIPETK